MRNARPVPVADNPQRTEAAEELSLIRGGPFYRAQIASRLIEPNRWNFGRRLTFIVAVGWLPLVFLTALFHPWNLAGLLKDYGVYSRMVIAVPILVLGQLLMESRFRMIVTHVREAGLLAEGEQKKLDALIATLRHLRDSLIPELIIVFLVYFHVATIAHSRLAMVASSPSWAVYRIGSIVHLTPAGWYYALISQLIYRFLIGLTLWKWLLWSLFLFRLSRFDLKLVATHPDHHGGLGFIGISPSGFAPLAFAISAGIGATWRYQILHNGAHLLSFKLPALVLLFLILLTAVGPLVFFLPRLAMLRRQGILHYGILAQLHSTDFHEKWIVRRAGHEDEFLAAPEVSTLTDFATSYEKIESMQPFLFEKQALIGLALAVALPLLPTVLAEIPLIVILKELLHAVK
jgi:hypothetical protein